MNSKPLALITGASRGIGQSIAEHLAAEGFNIAGVARTMGNEGVVGTGRSATCVSESHEVEFLPIRADISELTSHATIVSQVMERFGRIDLLVNNAGIAPEKRLDLLETTPEDFDRIMSTNLRGAFFLSQTVAGKMIEIQEKHPEVKPQIIFVTSVSAVASSTNRAAYCISKAGLSMTVRLFADRLAEHGINVYEIRPGIIATDMTAPAKEKYDRQIAAGLIPQGRWGQPTDVAKAVVAIARGYFDYSTGMIFEVSGGMNVQRL